MMEPQALMAQVVQVELSNPILVMENQLTPSMDLIQLMWNRFLRRKGFIKYCAVWFKMSQEDLCLQVS